MIFYSKNMSSAECNYEIYDKKLLIIIQAFKHWWSELKLIDISIKMFINHCYKRIKAEKGWSSNQFAEYASEYSAYWLELVSVSSSDMTQSLFSFFNISLFNIIFLSTSHSTHVTNTFSSSLAQSLNIT